MSDTPARKPKSFWELMDDIRKSKIKSRLKAAYRRKPKPARVKPQDEDTP